MTEAEAGLRETLATARVVGARLSAYADQLAGRFPLGTEGLGSLPRGEETILDALLFRFTNLVALLPEQVFRSVLLVEEIDATGLTNRDIANVMSKLGILASREDFAAAIVARNRLSHTYPTDDAHLATRLDEVFARIPVLLAALDGAIAHARRRGIPVDDGSV